jgi:uncharacterized protein (TIGR03083 family)
LKRTELLAQLIHTRAELQSLLDDLGENHWLTPGAAGEWTVRDVLAHLTAWEVDALTNLGKARRGAKPGTTQWTAAAIQKQNEIWHKELRDRPLRSVLADFEGARKQTLRVLEGLSDQEAAKPAAWLNGRSIADYLAQQTLDHEREHLEAVRAWRASDPGRPGEISPRPNGRGPRSE